MEYQIVEAEENHDSAYTPYGAAREMWKCKDHVIVLHGPAETGKSFACLQKIDALLWKYPGSHALICRKTYRSMLDSILVTYEEKVLGSDTPVQKYGGGKPEYYTYPNGSRLFVAGLDNPDKALSSERDFIYINQAEEIDEDDFEVLKTRCTGRAGHSPYPQIILDCNPGPSTHWIKRRADAGEFPFLASKHEDNPTLFDPETGEITERGKVSMAILDSLTGTRKQRLRYGKWVSAEGIVYEEWDESIHMVGQDDLHFMIDGKIDHSYLNRVVAGVDWGYTNPGVVQVWAEDKDGRAYLISETYSPQKTIDYWVGVAEKMMGLYQVQIFVCDPAEPAYIEQMQKAGIPAIKGYNKIRPGITAVQDRLKVQRDGKPRLFVVRDSLEFRDPLLEENKKPVGFREEMVGYVWNDRIMKEEPVKEDDHAMDAARYAIAYLDRVGTGNKMPGVWGRQSDGREVVSGVARAGVWGRDS